MLLRTPRHALLLVSVLAALAYGCTTRTIPPGDATVPGDGGDAGMPDAFVPMPDTGPEIDGGPRLDDVLIYAHSRNTLFTFSPFTNMVNEVGPFDDGTEESQPEMLDLAVDADGVVFTCSFDSLFRVDPETAAITKIGDFEIGDESLFALSFLHESESPDSTQMLIGATNAGAYYQIDRDNAATEFLGQYPEGYASSGDIVSVEGLGTYATLRQDGVAADVLARITFSSDGSSSVRVIGEIREGTTDFTQIFGLGYWGRNVYGFTNTGQLIRIDRTTGAATTASAATGTDQFWGAGVTTQAPFLI
ncbi:MAG: hypothetical protein AB8I08_18150 [Sandaracinaceae bacterium]